MSPQTLAPASTWPGERGSRATSTALTRNERPSAASAQPADDVAIRMPATGGPAIEAMLREVTRSVFADCSCSPGTRLGISPTEAGPVKAIAAPATSWATRNCQISARPDSTRRPRAPIVTASTRSVPSMISRRSQRSPATPPTSISTRAGTVPEARTRPSCPAEAPRPMSAKVTARADMALPKALTAWAVK